MALAADEFLEEVENVTDLLENSITLSLSATIENERAKLPSYTKEELMYLSCIIYCEAGSQEKKGKIAVANVIMNRVESKIFDHVTTIKEAIYDCIPTFLSPRPFPSPSTKLYYLYDITIF